MGRDLATRASKVIAILVVGFPAPARAATFVVSKVLDAGPGSLRQAMLEANAAPRRDTVVFAFPGPGPHTIAPATALPDLTGPVAIAPARRYRVRT